MIRIIKDIPKNVVVACSGGTDSMVILDFLKRGGRKVEAAYFHHGTDHGEVAYNFIRDYCEKNNIPFTFGKLKNERPKDDSWEEYWRNERMAFLNKINKPVITAHHLDDAVEWWIFSSFH